MANSDWVVRTVRQEPDESLLDAIGNQHSIETALADIIDNAIEYGGSEVTVQLITVDEELKTLRVVDNGRGMKPQVLEEAMQLRKKSYSDSSLSFFGMGMKMASLSQAGQLRVFTRSEDGETSGAQIRRADAGGSFNVEFLADEFCAEAYMSFRREPPGSGTVIEWQRIDNLPISTKSKEKRRFLEEIVKRVNGHVGLIFHRFISEGQSKIFVEIWDQPSQKVGTRTPAKATDPFDFRSPISNYPANFSSRTDNKTRIEVLCAIVPPNSDSDNVRIGGASLEELSGFYVYRHRRLVQVGGWQNLTQKSTKVLQLGRVKIDLTDQLIDAGLKLTAEKTSVRFSPEIQKAIASSKSLQLGKTFEDFLTDVEALRKQSNKRNVGLKPTTRLEGDENLALSRALAETVGFRNGSEHITIVSTRLKPDQVFELDVDQSTLRINHELFTENGPLNSEVGYEFFKATLYFLLQEYVSKTQLTKATYSKIEQMHRVLALSLGIQSLDSSDYESPIVATPAMLAGISQPQFKSVPIPPHEEDIEINFKKVWSSTEAQAKPVTFKALLEEWVGQPLVRNDEFSISTPAQYSDATESAPSLFTSDKDLAALGLEVWKSYKKNHDITLVSEELGKTKNEVVAILAQLVLRYEGKLDNREEAWQPDEPFTSSEREKLIAKFKDGQSLDRLSVETGRTCLNVAKEILDSPNFTAKISSSTLKKLGEAGL